MWFVVAGKTLQTLVGVEKEHHFNRALGHFTAMGKTGMPFFFY
jgi:hypothetical protein